MLLSRLLAHFRHTVYASPSCFEFSFFPDVLVSFLSLYLLCFLQFPRFSKEYLFRFLSDAENFLVLQCLLFLPGSPFICMLSLFSLSVLKSCCTLLFFFVSGNCFTYHSLSDLSFQSFTKLPPDSSPFTSSVGIYSSISAFLWPCALFVFSLY